MLLLLLLLLQYRRSVDREVLLLGVSAEMELRLLYIAVGSAALFYHAVGFIAHNNKFLVGIGLKHRFPPLQANRGFSKEGGSDPKLNKDAAKYLKEAGGRLDQAQGLYFQSRLLSWKGSDPTLFKNLEAYDPYNTYRDESAKQVHAKLVEYTWDTIAAYLPLTSPSPSASTDTGNAAVDSAVSKKLETIAQAACFRPNASVMDVGCGNGAIVPFLKRAGADLKLYLGLDLSGQMVDAAKMSHPGIAFEKSNFLTCSGTKKFDAILLNGVLQFLPNTSDALRRAASMLKPAGRLVIAHANGAGFVRSERRGNPKTVVADMPDVKLIQAVCDEIGAQFIGLEDIAPNSNYSMDNDIYLCVLQMR